MQSFEQLAIWSLRNYRNICMLITSNSYLHMYLLFERIYIYVATCKELIQDGQGQFFQTHSTRTTRSTYVSYYVVLHVVLRTRTTRTTPSARPIIYKSTGKNAKCIEIRGGGNHGIKLFAEGRGSYRYLCRDIDIELSILISLPRHRSGHRYLGTPRGRGHRIETRDAPASSGARQRAEGGGSSLRKEGAAGPSVDGGGLRRGRTAGDPLEAAPRRDRPPAGLELGPP